MCAIAEQDAQILVEGWIYDEKSLYGKLRRGSSLSKDSMINQQKVKRISKSDCSGNSFVFFFPYNKHKTTLLCSNPKSPIIQLS